MHIQITNAGQIAVPLTSTQGDGLAAEIEPNDHLVIEDEAITEATFGDHPGLLDEFEHRHAGKLFDTIRAFLSQYRSRQASQRGIPDGADVLCTIENFGPQALTVGAGDADDYEIESGETYTAQGTGRLHIRELGA